MNIPKDPSAELKNAKKVIGGLLAALKEEGILPARLLKDIQTGRLKGAELREEIHRLKVETFQSDLKEAQHLAVGLIFNPEKTHVLLTWRHRYEWQLDKLNAIGSTVNHGELPHVAIARIFKEQTGLVTDYHEAENEEQEVFWQYVGVRKQDAVYTQTQPTSYVLHVFVTTLPLNRMKSADGFKSEFGEAVLVPLNLEVLRRKGIVDLHWVAALCLGAMEHNYQVLINDPPQLEESDA